MRSLSVVLKVSERCNIDCDYCYFFYSGDTSFHSHPARISSKTIHAVTAFLSDAVSDLKLDCIDVVLHGGEPLLLGHDEFSQACALLRTGIETAGATLRLSVQTNGTLINPRWLAAFARHDVQVGVSLDGPRAINDVHRVDRRGRSTFDRSVAGFGLLRDASRRGELRRPPGILCVINPAFSAKALLEFFVDELGATLLDFLLPDQNPDTVQAGAAASFVPFVRELVSRWSAYRAAGNGVQIKIISAALAKLLGHRSFLFGAGPHTDESVWMQALTIGSEGSVYPDDGLRSTALWAELPPANVRTTTASQYLERGAGRIVTDAMARIPGGCRQCVWEHSCGGGFLQTRWSRRTGADNPSVYCHALQELFSACAALLVQDGVAMSELRGVFGGSASASVGTDFVPRLYQRAL